MLKFTIGQAVLSEATKHLEINEPFVQFRCRETLGKTKNRVPKLTTGNDSSKGFNETYSVQVLSHEDEIEFQLLDAAWTSSKTNAAGD